MMNIQRIIFSCTVFVTAVLVASCGGPPTPLTVLAGSELKDLQPLQKEIQSCAKVELDFKYIGTLDGAEQLAQGATYDLAWFSHAKYLTLLEQTRKRIVSQEKIMMSPVVMGVKASKARAFGWEGNQSLTWRDLAEKAASGELQYAMTNPASSNSGFTALTGVAAALSDKQNGFDLSSLDQGAIQDFFKGQTLTAGSSGWLADAYVKEQSRLDAIINYESVLLQLNASQTLDEPLVLIYPQEGIITADYPLMLLNGEQKTAYDRLVNCLRSEDIQRSIMKQTQRRPAIAQVRPDERFPQQLLVELPFPRTLDEVDNLLFAYLDKHRKPSHTFFVLDVSGSMKGESLEQLKRAIYNLTGLDQSITGQFARFRARETVTMIPFNHQPLAASDFYIRTTAKDSPSMQSLRSFVDDLSAEGGTAIYSALAKAYDLAAEAKLKDPNKFYTIVLLTDGRNKSGMDLSSFRSGYANLGLYERHIKTFPILFGQSDDDDMEAISELTEGRVFDAKKGSLGGIFKKIRGYQ